MLPSTFLSTSCPHPLPCFQTHHAPTPFYVFRHIMPPSPFMFSDTSCPHPLLCFQTHHAPIPFHVFRHIMPLSSSTFLSTSCPHPLQYLQAHHAPIPFHILQAHHAPIPFHILQAHHAKFSSTSCPIMFLTPFHILKEGAQWLSGRVLDSRSKGCGFEPHRRHCVVVLEHIYPSLVLVQPRKTIPHN